MILASKNFDYDQESREASALTELTDSLRVATAQAVADSNSARCVQEQSFINSPAGGEIVQIKDAYVVDEPVLLKVRIGSFAAPGWQSSAMPFPIDQLPPNESEHQLTLMLHEPTYCPQPKLKEILLPEWGPSSEAHFCFTPDAAGLFEGRITVLHRGRVLQTAMLRAEVFSSRALVGPGNEICLRDEVRVRRDWTSLDKREEFDLAIVCNHDGHETPRMTSVGAGRAWANDLSTIGAALEVINTSLSEVAMSTKDYKDGLDKGKNPTLLTTLASAGHQLFGDLVVFQLDKNSTGDIALLSDQLTNVQIVSTREDSIVPLEFIYDYGAPEVGAIVCPHHRAALHRGRCDADCVGKLDPAKHVCPMGFWGVRLVIERHVFDASRSSNAEGELVVEVEATAARSRLDIRRRALLSYSDRVATATVAPLIGVLNDNTQFPVHVAKSWDLWADNVLQFGPSLLVAFPHNDGAGLNRSLEVQGMPFQTRLIHFYDLPRSKVTASTKWHVRAPHDSPPIVFLLGCDTTGTATDFGSHVKAFKRGGAAVVVSTVATVFGEHAVTVGTTIIAELLKRSASASLDAGQPGRLGEVLRDAKRQALLNSLPMAMCVVAFGDADWFL